jgi:hypothetical protein
VAVVRTFERDRKAYVQTFERNEVGLMKSEPSSKEFNHKNGGIAFAHIDPSRR